MATVRILSAGTAQAAVGHFAAAFERETGNKVCADFGAVGAMKWLGESRGLLEMGITQITEIPGNKGVTYAGPPPEDLQARTVYAAGLATRAESAEAARDFIACLTAPSAHPVLVKAGYEFDSP